MSRRTRESALAAAGRREEPPAERTRALVSGRVPAVLYTATTSAICRMASADRTSSYLAAAARSRNAVTSAKRRWKAMGSGSRRRGAATAQRCERARPGGSRLRAELRRPSGCALTGLLPRMTREPKKLRGRS
ncbi:hypothetical protein M885DRAFT_107145, partial [Pelagophyceae sp. CCMP2097]